MINYHERLKIPIIGNNDTEFYSINNILIGKGYNRIVIGERGPYIEFESKHLNKKYMIIPEDEKWRLSFRTIYYIWFEIDKIKVYFQKKIVNYADYKIGKYYISPFELYVNKELVIERIKNGSIN